MIKEVADSTGATDFFEGVCENASLCMKTYQQVQAQMPTSSGGLDLSSMKIRQNAAFVGSLVPTLHTLLARQQGFRGKSFSQPICVSPTVSDLGSSIHTLLSTRVPSTDLAEIIAQGWVAWGGTATPTPAPEVHTLAAHDIRITRRAQHEITRLLNRICFGSFWTQLVNLPDNAEQGRESSSIALARHWRQCGQGANTWASTQSLEPACQIPPIEFRLTARRSLGSEEALSNRCLVAGCKRHNVDTQHARTYPRAGGKVRHHTPMVKCLGQLCKGMSIPCTMENGSPFTVDRNFRTDVVFHAGALMDAGSGSYRDKGLLLDVMFAEAQAASHLLHSSTSNSVAAAAAEARKCTHYEGSFDPRSYNINTFMVASFGRLGKQAERFLD
ncbi:unnamed protein product [Choristocarpus tenellus]